MRFAGFLQGRSLLAAYLAADLFVLPTRTHEGWGVVVQEALAAGCPVVAATGVQSGEDLVVEGRTGWRVPPDDEPTLAERLAWAAEHPGALREMEAPCREAARAVDASVVAPDLARFLEERLRGPARDTSATSDAAR